MTGGGSGGHITPILAVASELKKQKPDIKIVYIGLKGDVLADVAGDNSVFNESYFVSAGKFRRYHSDGLKQIFDLKTQYLNIRDLFKVFIGFMQSYRLLRKIKPEIVFSRGGFVIVPVCLAAKFKHIPYITHDSDSIPSLANRIIAPWAKMHFVALPKETYSYNQDITVMTGIPIKKNFIPVTEKLKLEYRKKISVPEKSKVLFITGGGQGATTLNDITTQIVPNLVAEFSDLRVIHLTGRNHQDKAKAFYDENGLSTNVKVIDFTNELHLYSGAADIIVTRAGATTLAECAIQGKACILIPSSYLVAGHQLENAKTLESAGAVKVVTDVDAEQDPNKVAKIISKLFKNPNEIKDLEKAITKFAVADAAGDIASRLLKIVDNDV